MNEREKDKKIDVEENEIFDEPKEGIKDFFQKIKDIQRSHLIIIMSMMLLLIVFLTITAFTMKQKNTNAEADSQANVVHSDSKDIRINEYVVSNKNTFRDNMWESPDWIELYNYGDEEVWLGDMYLSDNKEAPAKFQLPDVTVLPGEYLLVLASGKSETEDEYIRASFQLGKDDKNIVLSTNKEVLDMVEIEQLPTDISAGYSPEGGFGYFSQPTPGYANTTPISNNMNIEPTNGYQKLIIINEYLTNNLFSIADAEGEHSDWIELYNPNDYSVFLGDMYLSDDENSGNKFKMPDIELQAKGYALVYASGKAAISDEIHASFKIGDTDNKIVLSYKNGYIVDECEIRNLPADVSSGLDSNGSWAYFSVPTPNEANITASSESMDISADYKAIKTYSIVINEWMPNNGFGILDADGDASDWIELHNTSDEAITLDGFALTDTKENLEKWLFPAGTLIEPNGYLLIYASGKDKTANQEIHTNFSLDKEEAIYLVSPDGKIIEVQEMEYLPGNVSKGRIEAGYGYFSLPTPGKENTTKYVTEIRNSSRFMHGDLYISEVASSKIHLIRYKGRTMYEYVEIYNASDELMDLSGYRLEEDDAYYTFENVYIKPKDYLLVALKGWVSSDYSAIQAVGLSLNSSGETIIFKNSDGIIIDYFETGYLLGDYSSGRAEGNGDTRVFFMEKTPGKENSTTVYTAYSKKPDFSSEGGMKNEAFYLNITAADDAIIYYTLNGGIPDNTSSVYTQPIAITEDTVVRAVAISPNKLPSLCMTKTFILEKKHDLPIMCISSAPAGLFYDNYGIYADGPGHNEGPTPYFGSNYFKNLERLASFEYYETDGKIAVAFDGGIQIAGGYTREHAQKSLAIRLRDEYGLGEIVYPFFDEGTNAFEHLLLRNGGQDGYITLMRDACIQNFAQELGTVDCKRGRPVAVYINGEYWGLYNLRDKLNSDYFTIKYNLDDDVEINIITEYSEAKNGSADDWMDLKYFCQSTDFSIDENYYKLAERVDVQAFMDYVIVQTFFGNADTHNINFWKPEIYGGKWKPILFDLDLSVFDLGYSMVEDYLGSGYLGYHDHILEALKQSDIFMNALLERYSYIICNIYTEEHLISEIDSYYNLMENEMKYHVERYPIPSSYSKWQGNVDKFKTLMIMRRSAIVEELKDYFNLDEETTRKLFPYYYEN